MRQMPVSPPKAHRSSTEQVSVTGFAVLFGPTFPPEFIVYFARRIRTRQNRRRRD